MSHRNFAILSVALLFITSASMAENRGSIGWSTFMGGALADVNMNVVTDSAGNVYACGATASPDFPVTPGAYNTAFNGGGTYGADTWVAKFDGWTGELLWATFIGGSSDEEADGIAVDEFGAVYVLGSTQSADFPTTPDAFDNTYNGGWDLFLLRLSADGSSLLFSTFLGTSGDDSSWSNNQMALDPSGNLYFASTRQNGGWETADIVLTKCSVINNALLYSMVLGGSNRDVAFMVAVNPAGEAYVTGFTASGDFPTTPGAFDTTFNGVYDAFITKVNAEGTGIVYSTFIGGSGNDRGWGGLALDASGDVYISGITASDDFPVTHGAYQTTQPGQGTFVTRLSADGSALVASTFFATGAIWDMEIDPNGELWVTGATSAPNLPVTPSAFRSSLSGPSDSFIARFNISLTDLMYCSYLGGSSGEPDECFLALTPTAEIIVHGRTYSSDFPLTVGAADTTFGGDGVTTGEAYVAKFHRSTIDRNMDAVAWSTFLGGESGDINTNAVTDSLGNLYVCGVTQSADFPVTPGAYDTTYNGGSTGEYSGDAYVAKFDGATGALVWLTFIGGSGDEEADGILVNAAGEVVILGTTQSADFPTTPGAYDTTHNGSDDLFLLKLSADGSSLLFSTFYGTSSSDASWSHNQIGLDPAGNIYFASNRQSGGWDTSDVVLSKFSADGSSLLYSLVLGGSSRDVAFLVAVNPAGEAYVTGFTSSTDFPTTPSGYDTTFNGVYDGFVTKVNSSGTGFVYSTFIGGGNDDRAWGGLVLDTSGDVFISGIARSSDFPVTPGAYQVTQTGNANFVARLSADGTSLVASTLFAEGSIWSMDGDADGNIWISGDTTASNLPATPMAFCRSYSGGNDAFFAQLSRSLGNLLYCSYLGGAKYEEDAHLSTDSTGHVLIGGRTYSDGFPIIPGGADTWFEGDGVNTGESFAIKLEPQTIQMHYLTLFDSEMRALYDMLGLDFMTADMDADGLPDHFQAGLVAYVLSVQTHPYSVLVQSLYAAAIENLRAEANYSTVLQPYEHILAALLVTSNAMIDELTSMLSLTGSYTAFAITKGPDEPFSAEGDFDGDGSSNITEYEDVVAQGGTQQDVLGAFIESATDPSIIGGAPVPAAFPATLVALAGVLSILGLTSIRRQFRKVKCQGLTFA